MQHNPDEVLVYLNQAHAKGVQVLIDCTGIDDLLTDSITGHSHLPAVAIPSTDGLLTTCGGVQAAYSGLPRPNSNNRYRGCRKTAI